MNNEFKFRGGAWIGAWQITWPFVTLKIGKEQLILNNELFKKEYSFTRDEIEKIEIKKYFPIVAYGVRIIPRDKSKESKYYFWYWSFNFNKLTDTLRQLNWLV